MVSVVLLLVGCGGGSGGSEGADIVNDAAGGVEASEVFKLTGYKRDTNNDGIVDEVYHNEFDNKGNCTRFEDEDGIEYYKYDENNRVVYQSTDDERDDQLDEESSFQYNALGQLESQITTHLPGGGTYKINFYYENGQIAKYDHSVKEESGYRVYNTVGVDAFFNSSGYIEKVDIDYQDDGTIDDTMEFSYDSQGNRMSEKTTWYYSECKYDEDNNLIEEKSDYNGDGVFDQYYTLSYNPVNNFRKFDAYSMFSMAIEFDPYGFVSVDKYVVDRFRDVKFPSVEKQDFDFDGSVDEITTHHFDSDGLPVYFEIDTNADGTIDEKTYYIWENIQVQ